MPVLWRPAVGLSIDQAARASALHYNAVFVLALPVLLALWIDWAVRARSGRPRAGLSRRLSIAIVVFLVVFTIVRNLPFAAGLRGA